MRLNFWPFLAIIALCLSATSSRNDESHSSDGEELFVPTRDWQVVKKGQKIPKGLHVRVNLETGVTEAKILEENDNKKTRAVAEVPDGDGAQNSNSRDAANLKYSEAELKEALKNIKNDDSKDDYIKKVKSRFRTYEELKKELDDLNISPKTDAEMLKDLVEHYKEIIKDTETKHHDLFKLSVLEDLEYLVHQIDNANEFIRLNGFKDVVYHSINSTNKEIKLEALKLIGSSVQNNPKVQIHALETGSVVLLLRVLAIDSDLGVKNRAIFALGGILRRFPLAQLQFVENAGLTVFTELLEKTPNIKIQLKVVTLVNDLILEHKFALQDVKNDSQSEKVRQYSRINLKVKLKDYNWCKNVNSLLINVINIDSQDHDGIEKCLNAINSVIDTCDNESSTHMKSIVFRLQSQYQSLASTETVEDESSPHYYSHLFDLCSQITGYLNYKYKSEL